MRIIQLDEKIEESLEQALRLGEPLHCVKEFLSATFTFDNTVCSLSKEQATCRYCYEDSFNEYLSSLKDKGVITGDDSNYTFFQRYLKGYIERHPADFLGVLM